MISNNVRRRGRFAAARWVVNSIQMLMAKQHTGSSAEHISQKDYDELFAGKEEKALTHALDIRKFEIELYWKRATYFWTFIGATFAGFIGVRASALTHKAELSVMLSCLGVVFSFAWFLVNRGSKFWQENWEKHVDILENKITGPLYKTVLSRNFDDFTKYERMKDWITGPSAISVSKINQLISLYVFLLWLALLFYSFPLFRFSGERTWLYSWVISLTVVACASFLTPLGKTYRGGYWHNAELRKSRIKPEVRDSSPISRGDVTD